jgi:hypothetical protein
MQSCCGTSTICGSRQCSSCWLLESGGVVGRASPRGIHVSSMACWTPYSSFVHIIVRIGTANDLLVYLPVRRLSPTAWWCHRRCRKRENRGRWGFAEDDGPSWSGFNERRELVCRISIIVERGPRTLICWESIGFFQWDRSTWYPYRCLRAMDQTDQTEACPETVSSVAWYPCRCLRDINHQTDQTEACPKTVSSVAFVKPFILDNPSEMQWGKSDKWDTVFWARVLLGSDYYILHSTLKFRPTPGESIGQCLRSQIAQSGIRRRKRRQMKGMSISGVATW